MAHIISLQSHVAYGHAGNSAAVFPMQRLGMQVTDVNLLHYSNHLGHPTWRGDILPNDQLTDLLEGLIDLKILDTVDCIISGYIASREQANTIANFIKQAKTINPKIMYCCDPVIGDDHMGIYVQAGVAETIRDHLVPLADIITPNKFELSYLANQQFEGLMSLYTAGQQLHNSQNKHITLLTSFSEQDQEIGILLLTNNNNAARHITTPRYTLPRTAVGTGDVTTALFMSHYLSTNDPSIALERTANTMHAIAHYTAAHHLPELGIIQCQDAIATPPTTYPMKVWG